MPPRAHAVSNDSDFMNDPVLIFFVVIAAFLSYRLYTLLGSKGGHEPTDAERERIGLPTGRPERDGQGTQEDEAVVAPRSDAKPLPAWAETVRADYADFDPDEFVTGAKAAYEMIIEAFANGRLDDVRAYVDPDVMRTFEIAVRGRDNAQQTMEVTLVGIERAEVVEAKRQSAHLDVTVKFRSDQIRVTRNAEGDVIEGDPNRIDLVIDRWTFSRPLSSTDPNWTLTATEAEPPGAA